VDPEMGGAGLSLRHLEYRLCGAEERSIRRCYGCRPRMRCLVVCVTSSLLETVILISDRVSRWRFAFAEERKVLLCVRN
jgi:hypothetical protein